MKYGVCVSIETRAYGFFIKKKNKTNDTLLDLSFRNGSPYPTYNTMAWRVLHVGI